MQYANRQRLARSLEWQCLLSCMGTMAWCAADFCATQPRQLGAARSDFGPGTARRPPDRHEMQHHRARALCDHRRPCWQRSGRPCMAPPEPLPLGPGRSRQRATPRHVGARLAVCFALRSPQRTPAPSPSFSCAWVLPPEAAASSGGIQQLPAGRQEDLRPQLHQLALAWHAGKGTKDELSSTDHPAPFAVILAKNSSLRHALRSSRRSPVLLFQLNLSV
jgi:hypothetical protein